MVPPLDPPESERLQIWLKVILIISNHVIYHIQSSILGGSMMMEPTITKTSHTEVRSSAGYCVSRSPKEAFLNDGSWLQLHEQ